MTDKQQTETSITRHAPSKTDKDTVVFRVPKPNLQIIVLGLIAIITLFQTFQLIRINSSAGSANIKTAPAAASNTPNTQPGTGSNADVPQSMVGGC